MPPFKLIYHIRCVDFIFISQPVLFTQRYNNQATTISKSPYTNCNRYILSAWMLILKNWLVCVVGIYPLHVLSYYNWSNFQTCGRISMDSCMMNADVVVGPLGYNLISKDSENWPLCRKFNQIRFWHILQDCDFVLYQSRSCGIQFYQSTKVNPKLIMI